MGSSLQRSRLLIAIVLAALAALAGCATPRPGAGGGAEAAAFSGLGTGPGQAVAPLAGRIVFPAPFSLSASMTDVAEAATVSLIDTGSNQTVRTALTDPSGRFLLEFGRSFVPGTSVYVLEAVKGLANNHAGATAARVRTLIRSSGGSWLSLTAGGIVVSRGTTALSIVVSHRGLDPAPLIGKLTPGSPDVFADEGTGIGQTEYVTVLDFVTTSLGADRDPVENIGFSGSAYFLNATAGPVIGSVSPNTGSVGGTIVILGQNFATTPGGNTVKFNGVTATVSAAGATSLSVIVPEGATSGSLTLATALGASSTPFTILPGLDGGFTF